MEIYEENTIQTLPIELIFQEGQHLVRVKTKDSKKIYVAYKSSEGRNILLSTHPQMNENTCSITGKIAKIMLFKNKIEDFIFVVFHEDENFELTQKNIH